MFRKLMKNKKAQQTAEYALLISLVVAAIIAMQTYAQRTIQARIRDASQHLATATSNLGTTVQYEPYYLETDYTTERDETTEQRQNNASYNTVEDSTRTRASGGFQSSAYNQVGDGI
jgi:Flp pilus assembly pilin Flp